MQHKTIVKSDLRDYVRNRIADKIVKLKDFIDFTIEASHDIKKTPKYDSTREEMQEEIYQMQKQLAFLHDLRRKLTRVVNTRTDRVQMGSVIFTNKARFYISVSLGEFFYDGDRYYAISEESPMAKTMFGKKSGDSFILNNISQTIETVF